MDQVAALVGRSRPTLTKATRIVDAAEEDPEIYGDLLREMDETGNIGGVYIRLRELQGLEPGKRRPGKAKGVSVRKDKNGDLLILSGVDPVPTPCRFNLRRSLLAVDRRSRTLLHRACKPCRPTTVPPSRAATASTRKPPTFSPQCRSRLALNRTRRSSATNRNSYAWAT